MSREGEVRETHQEPGEDQDLSVIFCIAGNISFFISRVMRYLLALTFCWVIWAGRVSRRRKRPVETTRLPHHGNPGLTISLL